MCKVGQRIQRILSLGIVIVLLLLSLYRIILEIDYSKVLGYNTYTNRISEFSIGFIILFILTTPMLFNFYWLLPYKILFTGAAIQFLIAVMQTTTIFNGGSFFGNGIIRMILKGKKAL